MFESVQNDFSQMVENISSEAQVITGDKKLPQTLDRLQLFLVLATIFITPLVFFPFGTDWFDIPKTLFFAVMVGASAVVGLVRLFVDPKFKLTGSVIDKNLILVITAVVVSAALSVNKVNSLLSEPSQFFLLSAFFFVIVNTLNRVDRFKMGVNLLVGSSAILGLIAFAQTVLSLMSKSIVPIQTLIVKNPWLIGVSPANNPYTLGLMLLIVTPISIAVLASQKEKKSFGTIVATTMILLGLASVAFILVNQKPIFLDADTGRKIATGVIGKTYQSALFGIGPGEYSSAFTQYKDIAFNSTPLWSLNFMTANSFAFYLLTIGGLALLFTFGSILIPVYHIAKKRLQPEIAQTMERAIFISLGISLVLMIVVPLPFLALFTVFLSLGLLFAWYDLNEINSQTFDRKWSKTAKVISLGVTVLVSAAIIYGQSLLFLADVSFKQGLEASAANQGLVAYNAQVKSAQLAFWKDAYRVQLSRTNLALADALASQPNLSDQQKQTVVQLVQQSLAEARNAAALEPNNAGNWANLALIYRNLINFAQGADQWAVTAQTQAIALDPMNPQYRLDLGGIYFAAKDYQTAAQHFAASVQLKPDLANTHYNLAQALKQLNIKDQAAQQLQLVAQLVCTPNNSNKSECDKIKSEIAELTTNTKPEVAGAATKATTPVEEQKIKPSTQSAAPNLLKAKTQPQVVVSSPSGELAQ